MAKSKAQRMKEYRARKKEQFGGKWLKKEAERVKGYFIPMNEKTVEQKLIRQEQNRKSQATFSMKRKQARQNNNTLNITDGNNNVVSQVEPEFSTNDNTLSSTSTTDQARINNSSGPTLTVKLPFPSSSRTLAGNKRVSRALARSYRTIETLEDKNEELKKKLRNAQKKLNRLEMKQTQKNTPRSKSDRLLKDSGIDPKAVPEVRKQLVFAECLSEEIKSAKKAQDKCADKTQIVHNIASGKVLKKYRLKHTLEQKTTLNRRKAMKNKCVMVMKKSRLIEQRKRITEEIVQFLEREDNSRLMPGKADAVKTDNGKKQKRVLNDYMYNLHLKFLSESSLRISRSSFYKCRPKYFSLVNFASRSICLCSKHQNFSFLLRALKSMDVTNCTNPDKFVEMYCGQPTILSSLLNKLPTNGEDVKYQQWKRVKLNSGKERQRVVEMTKSRDEFIGYMSGSFMEFVKHVQRVKDQYNGIKSMKECFHSNHVIIQMDFAENYTCNTLEEIQSAYWNSCMITLHPVVIYYRSGEENKMKHASYVYISEVLNHNAAMVISIIDKMMVNVKGLVSDVKYVHFWTDSPSSQYRNKTIFDLVASFPQRYGLYASWNYFESGHGKGPCDGVGGTTKRHADNAVKQGKVIQDADDFYAWATEEIRGIAFEKVTEAEYIKTKETVDIRNQEIKPLKGSMAIHAVAGIGDGRLITRETTCACSNCFGNSSFIAESTCKWNMCCISSQADRHRNKDISIPDQDSNIEVVIEENTIVAVGDFIVAKYESKCYIGEVCEVGLDDNTVHVNFMTNVKKVAKHFKWPSTEDKLWIKFDDIVQVIEKPTPTSKTGRIFSVTEEVLKWM